MRPHITLKFFNFKSWVSFSRYRYNCMQYMRLREYMHHLRTRWHFKLCMHFADSVQYVIDDLVQENVPAYRCLWPLYVNFYKEEKKHILKLPKQKKWSPEARWVLLWFQNFRIDICFSRDFCRIRLLYVR